MSRGTPPQEVVAIGAPALIAGLALAGVRLCPAVDAAQVREAWPPTPWGPTAPLPRLP